MFKVLYFFFVFVRWFCNVTVVFITFVGGGGGIEFFVFLLLLCIFFVWVL